MSFPSFDAIENFVATTVATAPSPATSGTSLVVASGTGGNFPATPFDAVTWPSTGSPTGSTAEIVRVTNIVTDTLTIVRGAQTGNDSGGLSGASIAVGWNIARCVMAKDVLDTQQAIHQGDYMASAVTTSSSSAAPANTTLAFNIGSNQVFQFQFFVQALAANTTTGSVYAVTVPSGATANYVVRGTTTSTAVVETATTVAGTYVGAFARTTSATTPGSVHVTGTVTCATTAGTVGLLFAASVTAFTQTVARGSMAAFRVA